MKSDIGRQNSDHKFEIDLSSNILDKKTADEILLRQIENKPNSLR